MEKLAFKGGEPVQTTPPISWPVVGNEEKKLLLEILESGNWSMNGPKEMEFSEKFASMIGAKYGFCVANGTVSLEIALRALDIGPGDEVIVPALTWPATASAVITVGAVPVFADITEKDWCIDPESVKEKINSRTRAIIPVHLYNQMANMDELSQIANENRLSIIEDCAHAHGSKWKGRSAGTLGNIGSFSFQQSKTLTSGEGGFLVTDDERLAEKIYHLKNCGRKWRDNKHFGFGSNHRITEFQAAVLLGQLSKFEQQLSLKETNIQRLSDDLSNFQGIDITERKVEMTRQGAYQVSLNYQPEMFNGIPRELFVEVIQAEGIPIEMPYPTVYESPIWIPGKTQLRPHSKISIDQLLGLNSKCLHSEKISQRTGLVLPHYTFLWEKEEIIKILAAFEKVQRHASTLRFDSIKKEMRKKAKALLECIGGK